MKTVFKILAGIALTTIVGCSTTTLVETQYRDGKYQQKVYTKYYDDGGYLFGEDVGMIVCVDDVKKNIPILYGIQRWIGALGPSDLDAEGLVTLYFWNLSQKDYSFEIESISNANSTLTDFNGRVQIPSTDKTKHSIIAGNLPISNYGKEVDLSIVVKSSAETFTKHYTAHRRTNEDFERFFGPKNESPYPWTRK